jgi:hypothetical protein
MKYFRHLASSLSILILLTGTTSCSSSNEKDTAADNEQQLGRGCFYIREAQNWTVLDRQNLIVYAPSKQRAYKVQLAMPSFELRSVAKLGFKARDNRICGRPGDDLFVGSGSNGIRYSIMDVYRLTPEEVDRLLEAHSDSGNEKPSPEATSPSDAEAAHDTDNTAGSAEHSTPT